MTPRSFAALAPIAAVAMIAAACSQQGGVVYKVPLADAHRVLLTTGLPPLVFGSQPPDYEVRAEGESDIVWIAHQNGAVLFRYVAHLSAAGDGATRVKLEMKGEQGGPAGDISKKLAEHPRIRDLYMVAMTERIASALEQRPYEMSRIYPAMTAATVANMGQLNASADQAAAASEKSDRDTIAKAYADEAAGRR